MKTLKLNKTYEAQASRNAMLEGERERCLKMGFYTTYNIYLFLNTSGDGIILILIFILMDFYHDSVIYCSMVHSMVFSISTSGGKNSTGLNTQSEQLLSEMYRFFSLQFNDYIPLYST